MTSAQVRRVVNDHVAANTYVVPTRAPGRCLLIDPGLSEAAIAAVLDETGLVPEAILCTHGHFDHLGSAAAFRARFGAPVYLHAADRRVARSANFLLMACKIDRRIEVPAIDHAVADGAVVALAGGDEAKFTHVPGHTPGSCLIGYGDAVFTGDTIYRDTTGMVKFPGEDPERLRESILSVWERIGEDRTIFPGHGGAGRFGEVKRRNAALRALLGLEEAAA